MREGKKKEKGKRVQRKRAEFQWQPSNTQHSETTTKRDLPITVWRSISESGITVQCCLYTLCGGDKWTNTNTLRLPGSSQTKKKKNFLREKQPQSENFSTKVDEEKGCAYSIQLCRNGTNSTTNCSWVCTISNDLKKPVAEHALCLFRHSLTHLVESPLSQWMCSVLISYCVIKVITEPTSHMHHFHCGCCCGLS